MIGKDKAAEVISIHGTNDPGEIVRAEGLSIERLDFGGARFREFSISGVIFLPLSTDITTAAEERSNVAHALGHHFLHVGNQVWMRRLDSIWRCKQERQAEEFAAWLLVPESENPNLVGLTPMDISDIYDVDLSIAEVRAGMSGPVH